MVEPAAGSGKPTVDPMSAKEEGKTVFETLKNQKVRTLIDAERIRLQVHALAVQIEKEYRGQSLTVVGVLKGSVFFLVDLIRELKIPLRLEFYSASSYGDGMKSSGQVSLDQVGNSTADLRGRHVLVVDDILDSGRTLSAIVADLEKAGPESIKTCVLIDKKTDRAVDLAADYRAFQIPEVFIVGYGLDYAEQYRNLPYIAVLEAPEDTA